MVVPNVLLAIWRYHQRNRIDLRHAAALGITSFCFAIAGAAVAVSLDAGHMRIAFIGFLLALAAYMLLRVFFQPPPGGTELRHPWPLLGALGAGSGAVRWEENQS